MRDIMTMLPDLPQQTCLCAELRVDDEIRPIIASGRYDPQAARAQRLPHAV